MKRNISLILCLMVVLLTTATLVVAQKEVLTNADVVAMSKAGLSVDLIITKIKTSDTKFDTAAKALIELKNAKVDDEVISLMVETAQDADKLNTRRVETVKSGNTEVSEAAPEPTRSVNYKTPLQLLRDAKTIAFKKDSLYPKIKEVESSLLKKSRVEKWNKFGLTITQYTADADLIVEIGHDFGTNYNFRVTDVKTGRVIAASSVSSLGGALAGNVADKLIKRFDEINVNE